MQIIDPLPPIDHSEIDYNPFTKNFYEEHEDIAQLSEGEISSLRTKLGLRVRRAGERGEGQGGEGGEGEGPGIGGKRRGQRGDGGGGEGQGGRAGRGGGGHEEGGISEERVEKGSGSEEEGSE